jgi:RNA 3'-terminal phosphate cyclase
MANPAVEAALQSALANQQYDSVAPILDAAELEVHVSHEYLAAGVERGCAETSQGCSCALAVQQPRRAQPVASCAALTRAYIQPAAVSGPWF